MDAGGPLVAGLADSACELIVAIPARDEGATVGATLRALARQRDLAGQPLDRRRYEVILLANNCRDDTVRNARRVAREHPGFALHIVDLHLPGASHVGHARRLVMDEACRRLMAIGRPDGVIATTDGDTIVSNTWVAATLHEIRRGADSVGGRIVIHPDELRTGGTRILHYHLKDVGYRSLVAELESKLDPLPHNPWPRHFQHFGASMAVTAGIYRRAGGLPVRPYLEDVALYERLKRLDARIRHSPLVRVTTSGRMTGRTSFGFAVQLARWQEMEQAGDAFLVASAAEVEANVLGRRLLRGIWRSRDAGIDPRLISTLAGRLHVSPDWLMGEVASRSTFGALWQAVERQQGRAGRWEAAWPPVTIDEAIRQLRYRLDGLRRMRSRLALLEQIEPVALVPGAGYVPERGGFPEPLVDDVAG